MPTLHIFGTFVCPPRNAEVLIASEARNARADWTFRFCDWLEMVGPCESHHSRWSGADSALRHCPKIVWRGC